MENNNFLVRVNCVTFNHALYIEDAMNGFTMQKTTFPFICVIIDDASSDGEPKIIRQYLQEHFDLDDTSLTRHEENEDCERFYSRHKRNHNCFFLVVLLKYNHYSIRKSKAPYVKDWIPETKYIAICEGDDYWINPQKLQLQISFLEKNPDYSLSHSNFELLYMQNNKLVRDFKRENNIALLHKNLKSYDLLTKYRIMSLTVVYPSKYSELVRKDDAFLFSGYFKMADTQIWYGLSKLGKIHYIDQLTSVYRVTPNSLTHQKDSKKFYRFSLSSAELRLYIGIKDKLPHEITHSFRKRYDNALYIYMAFDKFFTPLYPLDINNVRLRWKVLGRLQLLKWFFYIRRNH